MQDTGSGLASVGISTYNATAPAPSFTSGTTAAVDVTATKIGQTKGATLTLTVTDVAGNTTVCDPIFGASLPPRTAILGTGRSLVLPGFVGDSAHLFLKTVAGRPGAATVTVRPTLRHRPSPPGRPGAPRSRRCALDRARQYRHSLAGRPGKDLSSALEMTIPMTAKKRYCRPCLERLGLLRHLTRFSF